MDYRNEPLLLVIFGVTGDLAHRKILPALCRLLERGDLPDSFRLVGVSRQEYDVNRLFDDFARQYDGKCNPDTVRTLRGATSIQMLDMTNEDSYVTLRHTLENVSSALGKGTRRMYYLSIPAQAFIGVIDHLGRTGHNAPFPNEADAPRLLIEKPFGYNLASAEQLVAAATTHYGESQLYRIDHYLAKETAQNILTFRFNNPLFQTIWNARHIDRISITAHEAIGIEGRVNFYEQTGAVRDFIQSHLLQLLALITMEQPGKLDSASIRRAKRRLLESITPIEKDSVPTCATRGQYDSYRQEVGDPDSATETFARITLEIDNEQWRGTFIELSTGKALDERKSQITVHFRAASEQPGSNTLVFRLQPSEGITLKLEAKTPGLGNETKVVDMAFDYQTSFGSSNAEAYERVIVDAIRGDQSLFLSSEEVLASWRIVESVIEAWQSSSEDIIFYKTGENPEKIR